MYNQPSHTQGTYSCPSCTPSTTQGQMFMPSRSQGQMPAHPFGPTPNSPSDAKCSNSQMHLLRPPGLMHLLRPSGPVPAPRDMHPARLLPGAIPPAGALSWPSGLPRTSANNRPYGSGHSPWGGTASQDIPAHGFHTLSMCEKSTRISRCTRASSCEGKWVTSHRLLVGGGGRRLYPGHAEGTDRQ